MTDNRSIEDLIDAHIRRTVEYDEFLEALQRATETLQHRLCTECGFTRDECEQTSDTHEYSPMTPTQFLLLTVRRTGRPR